MSISGKALLVGFVATACGPVIEIDDSGSEATTRGDSEAGASTIGLISTGIVASTSRGEPESTGGGDTTTGSPVPEPPDLPPLPPQCPADTLQGDVFNPNEVYLAGTLSSGACYLDVLAHWSSPNDAVAGFDCYFDERQASIRPTDGRLLYTNTFEDVLREFHCDVCPWQPERSDYPDDPVFNDTAVSDCAEFTGWSMRFLLSPDGTHLRRCDGSVWTDENDEVVYQGEFGELLHLGHGNWALAEAHLVHLYDHTVVELVPPFVEEPVATRADVDGGFFAVVGEYAQPELLHIGLDGMVKSLGLFPPAPEGVSPAFGSALDGCLALYQFGRDSDFGDVILRRAVGEESRIVYSEATDPLVQVHISGLVTGV